MTFLQHALVYLVSVPIFFLIDLLWIGVVAAGFYRSELGSLLGPVNWAVAIGFYLIFLVGLSIFAISPALLGKGVWHAVIFGALFGFFAYATYDLTNWATIRGWSPVVSVVDIVWGAILSAVVSGTTYLIASTFIVR